jgi:hypothetical protein
MKHLAFLVFALFAAAAIAQDKPAAAPEAAKEPAKEAAKPAPSKSAAAHKKGTPSRRTEDARHCLEKASNTEVIKCAEEYL